MRFYILLLSYIGPHVRSTGPIYESAERFFKFKFSKIISEQPHTVRYRGIKLQQYTTLYRGADRFESY